MRETWVARHTRHQIAPTRMVLTRMMQRRNSDPPWDKLIEPVRERLLNDPAPDPACAAFARDWQGASKGRIRPSHGGRLRTLQTPSHQVIGAGTGLDRQALGRDGLSRLRVDEIQQHATAAARIEELQRRTVEPVDIPAVAHLHHRQQDQADLLTPRRQPVLVAVRP
jgi:hypothetical protein